MIVKIPKNIEVGIGDISKPPTQAEYDEIELLNEDNIQISTIERENTEVVKVKTTLLKTPFFRNLPLLLNPESADPEEYYEQAKLNNILVYSCQDNKRVCYEYQIPKAFIKSSKYKYYTKIKQSENGYFIKAGYFESEKELVDWHLVYWDLKNSIENFKNINWKEFTRQFKDIIYSNDLLNKIDKI